MSDAPGKQLGGQLDERAMLLGFLDWYRAIVKNKVADLDPADATRVMTATGVSPLGVVKHLAFVERSWFQLRFAGRDVDVPLRDNNNAVQFELGPSDRVESVIAFYESQIDTANEIAASAASLDEVSARPQDTWGYVTMRWILLHMIEETARHAGHLDILREQIDGRTGS